MSYLNTFKILIIPTTIACSLFPAVRADVLIPNTSRVNYCFEIANTNKYPNYLFVANITSPTSDKSLYNRIIESGKCYPIDGYRPSAQIYAIPKKLVKPQEIVTLKKQKSIPNFDQKKSAFIASDDPINPLEVLEDRYNVVAVKDVLEIVTISPKSLKLKYREVAYTSKQGKVSRRPYQNQNERPSPGFGNLKLNLIYLLASFLALTGMTIVYRKSKSRSN
jgi:hypothetical protein